MRETTKKKEFHLPSKFFKLVNFLVLLALWNQRRPRTTFRQTLFVADDFEAKADKTNQVDESDETDDAITDAAEADTADSVNKATDATNEAEFDNPTIVEANSHDVAKDHGNEAKNYDLAKGQVAA